MIHIDPSLAGLLTNAAKTFGPSIFTWIQEALKRARSGKAPVKPKDDLQKRGHEIVQQIMGDYEDKADLDAIKLKIDELARDGADKADIDFVHKTYAQAKHTRAKKKKAQKSHGGGGAGFGARKRTKKKASKKKATKKKAAKKKAAKKLR